MPELRQDLVTGRWVVIATERAKRPESFSQSAREEIGTSDNCPFCEGHEHLTPPEVMAYRQGSGPDSPGWTVRVVPNKYPAFTLGNQELDCTQGIYECREGLGVHEVIVGNPDHRKGLAQLDDTQVAEIIRAYRARYLALKDDERLKFVLLMVNQGKAAGASLEHPHSQVFAVPLVPPIIKEEMDGSLKFYKERGECVFCEIIRYEASARERLVLETENFISLVPYAARVPFETWILPKKHEERFEDIADEAINEFAGILRATLAKLYVGLGDPPYNYYIHTSPCRVSELKENETGYIYHWHLEILPKLSIMAGFELGLGTMINVSNPEQTAEFLRSVDSR